MLWKSVKELENRDGTLFIENCSAIELAKQYQTPLYVYSENRIRENYQRLDAAYKKYYPNFQIYYAVKANNNPAIVNLMRSMGAGADCSCVPEIMIAKNAGIDSKNILYSGVYNSDEELAYAVQNKVRINLEDGSQLDRLSRMDVPEFLCFRVNPGIGQGGRDNQVYAGPDAKFGIIERDIFLAYAKAKELGVKRFGIHMMTGSNILSPDYFEQIVGRLLDIAGPIAQKLDIEFEFIDIGGSLGVPYTPEENELPIEIVAKKVATVLNEKLEQYSLGKPLLIHEPGRYLVCDAGVLLSKVTSIKNGYKKFVGLDAGMNTLLRPALYNAYHHLLYANDLNAAYDEKINVVGPICENTDHLARDRLLPSKMKENDVVALLDVGAYGFGMSSQYNTRPQAAEVLLNHGQVDAIRKRQSFDDLIHNVKVPIRLQQK